MTRSAKLSILTAAIVSAIAATEARAGFTYDLRFASGTEGVSQDLHKVVNPSVGTTYTLQLWGRITGDTTLTNDVWTKGYVSVQSIAGISGNYLIGGGITNGAQNLTNFPQSTQAGVGNDFSGDGIADWGGSNGTASSQGTKWMYWQNTTANASPGPGFLANGTVAGSSQPYAGDPTNSWEVLIATYTVTVAGLSETPGAETTFNVLSPLPTNVRQSSTGNPASLGYYQDGSTTNQTSASATIGLGATFVSLPEPASLGVLALGGLALLARRRK
jgi:hypothetical protein